MLLGRDAAPTLVGPRPVHSRDGGSRAASASPASDNREVQN